ncbi:MAG: ABC transporter substrate-binding protein [Candidatus Dormibacter sp.]|uniref:ABC transporter substrate-binding protein n=1 Tax=Candidatus Dormibacter sp. TaxID=2973982 RepID=UPI003D9AFD23
MRQIADSRPIGFRLGAVVAAGLALLSAACGSGNSTGSSSNSGGGPLVVGILAPFTGQDAALGPAYFAACLPAVRAINAAGGVQGHQLQCKQFDTRGDPADAVPATHQMIASNSNLMMVIGCTSDEAASVVPILEQAKIPSFCQTGQSEFNKSTFKYFHRLVPPDEYDAYAMVGIALYHSKFKRIALVFGNDIGSQAFVEPAKKAIERNGGVVAINQALALGQPSYRTEVQKLIDAKPDVILTEALGSTDATYLAELKQLHGMMIPVIGSSATIDPVWFKAVSAAIGVPDVLQYYLANDTPTDFQGPGYEAFRTNLLASASDFADAPKYTKRASTIHLYDGVVMTALAMETAKSSDRATFNPAIIKVGNGVSGATEVNTYKAGLDAIKAGKTVHFIGAGGATKFDQYQNSQTGYVIAKYDEKGDEQVIAKLSQAQIDHLITSAQ